MTHAIRMGGPLVAVLLAFTAQSRPAMAEVKVMPAGFVVHVEALVAAPPARVFDAFVHVGRWWDPEHTYSLDAHNLSIDARAGGCFCERLAKGGGVEHMRVVNVQPPSLLRMSGAMGPMQGSGLAGALTVQFKPQGEGTQLVLQYAAGGWFEGGFEQLGPGVEAMLAQQLQRLKRYVETGKPAE